MLNIRFGNTCLVIHEYFTMKYNINVLRNNIYKKGTYVLQMKLRNRHKLDAKNPFKPNQVNKILEDIITQGVSQFYYNHQEASQLCQELASQIRTKVKALNYDR